jgi:beta-phosphoglucomutase
MFEAAIFDWDGTLADTRHAIVVSFHKALTEIGLDVSTDYVERRIGIGSSDTFRDILRSKGMAVDETLVAQLVKRKSEVQIDLADKVRLFDGTRELLDALQNKMKAGLASMNNLDVIRHLLKINRLEECFQVILTADRVAHSKPDPEIFLKTAMELKTDPARCVVFEDSLFGVKAAKAGGMGCVAVTTGVYSKQELGPEKPDLIVENLKDPQILSFVCNDSRGLW